MIKKYFLWSLFFNLITHIAVYPSLGRSHFHPRCYFSPYITSVILNLINHEKKSICLAVYTFTDAKITEALKHAVQRNVLVSCVIDPYSATTQRGQIKPLISAGINVNQFVSDNAAGGIMHHKFMLFEENDFYRTLSQQNDKHLVVTGSYNFTKKAGDFNCENMAVIHDSIFYQKYMEEYDKVLSQSVRLRHQRK